MIKSTPVHVSVHVPSVGSFRLYRLQPQRRSRRVWFHNVTSARLHAGDPIHVSHHILCAASVLRTTSVLSALFKEESSEPDVLRGVLKLKGISQDLKSFQNKCSVLTFYTRCCVYHSKLPELLWGKIHKLKKFFFLNTQNGTQLENK